MVGAAHQYVRGIIMTKTIQRNIYAEVLQEVEDRMEIFCLDEGYALERAYKQSIEDIKDGLETPTERSEYACIWKGHTKEALRSLKKIPKLNTEMEKEDD